MTNKSAVDDFTAAWRRGIALAGKQFFGDQTGAGASKWDLAPRYDDVVVALGWLSSGESAFLAALYSFYNPAVGAELLATIGAGSPGELAARLDEQRRRVIADLVVTYRGW